MTQLNEELLEDRELERQATNLDFTSLAETWDFFFVTKRTCWGLFYCHWSGYFTPRSWWGVPLISKSQLVLHLGWKVEPQILIGDKDRY